MKAKGFYTTRTGKSKEEKCARPACYFLRMTPDRPEEDEDLDEEEEREEDEVREEEE